MKKYFKILFLLFCLACLILFVLYIREFVSESAPGIGENACLLEYGYDALENRCAPIRLCSGLECSAFLNKVAQTYIDEPPMVGEGTPDEYTTTLASYRVKSDGSISLESLVKVSSTTKKYTEYIAAKNQHFFLWTLVYNMLPLNVRPHLNSFAIVTDGPGRVAAFSEPRLFTTDKWRINVDSTEYFYSNQKPRGLEQWYFSTAILLHEIAHVLTLNDAEVKPDPLVFRIADATSQVLFNHPLVFTKCSTVHTRLGCAKSNSLIFSFYKDFWEKDRFDEYKKLLSEQGSYNMTNPPARFFYNLHLDEFVTWYAAVGLEEDIAESWLMFILKDRPDVASRLVKDKKIIFFYQFNNLVKDREVIRGKLVELLSNIQP